MSRNALVAYKICFAVALTACVQSASWGWSPPPLPELKLPAHPRLMLSDSEIPAILERARTQEFAATRLATLYRDADNWLAEKTELPPRGGQWWHWYACKKDGSGLKQLSPTQHRCPACGTVYSGFPYDDVPMTKAHDRLATMVQNLGVAYRLSKNVRYADKARGILLDYAARYLTYPLHDRNGKPTVGGGGHIMAQPLDESTWLIRMTQGADLIWDYLSAEDRKTIETGLLRPAVETIRQQKKTTPNIFCWHNSAIGLVGFLLGDRELITHALMSENGFFQKIHVGVDDDGQWYEGAWHYHLYTISAMIPLAEAAMRSGLELYGYQDGKKSLQAMFDAPLHLAMPNGVMPEFNDSDPEKLAGSSARYEVALARYGKPDYARVIGLTPRTSLESLLLGVYPLPTTQGNESGSRNYSSAGFAVLQDGKGPDATWLCLKYGTDGGIHGHPDKLTFILYHRGLILGYDAGTGRYGVPIHDEWQKSSIAHNTLTVDAANQKQTTGRSLAFISKPGETAVLADSGSIYEGVSYRRAVALLGSDLVLVLDLVNADRPHQLDLAYHHKGEWKTAPQGEAVAMPDVPSYRYLQGMVAVHGAPPAIQTRDIVTGVAIAAAEDGRLLLGTGAGTSSNDRVPCAIMRLQSDRAHVGWVLDLQGGTPKAKVIKTADGWALEATVRGKTIRLITDGETTLRVER